jgi:hypothetical protein
VAVRHVHEGAGRDKVPGVVQIRQVRHVSLLERILLLLGEHGPVRIGNQQRYGEPVKSHDRIMSRRNVLVAPRLGCLA